MGNKDIDWSLRMNAAIDYMESNLEDEIDILIVAKKAQCSSFHFQKMFFAIFGITPAEYIRYRRLTLAATELSVGNAKIIDISFKYNYESPTSFTRAFKNFHGMKPSEVRKPGAKLFSFNRASFQIEIKGGNRMNYKIVERPAFEIMGKSKLFTHETFFKEAPKFWKDYVGTEEYKVLWNINQGRSGKVSEAAIMSIYLPNDKNRESFTDTLGVEIDKKVDLKHFSRFTVPSATYAEFYCTYQTSAKMNKQIYGEWLPSSGYERDPKKADIAAYFPAAFLPMTQMAVRWWIPVIKKK